jgi:hypothetical protein
MYRRQLDGTNRLQTRAIVTGSLPMATALNLALGLVCQRRGDILNCWRTKVSIWSSEIGGQPEMCEGRLSRLLKLLNATK